MIEVAIMTGTLKLWLYDRLCNIHLRLEHLIIRLWFDGWEDKST